MRRSWFMVVLLSALVSQSHAAIPGADDRNVYTRNTEQRDRLAFNQRTMVQAYQQFGHHDAKWDSTALKLLEFCAQHLTQAALPLDYRTAPPLKDVLPDARAVVESGCDDPLVLDMAAIVFDDLRYTEDANRAVRRAFDQFARADCKYPPLRAFFNARRCRKLCDRMAQKDRRDEFDAKSRSLAVAIVARNEQRGIERRFIVEPLWEEVDPNWPIEDAEKFISAINQEKDADPWLVKMLSGAYYVRAAWQARGGEYADKVKPEQWELFFANLDKARAVLVDAWKIEPTLPHAPGLMISVTMGKAAPGEDERLWFERAVTAQLDYMPAYTRYITAMLPRWNGDYVQLLDFAFECADTKRYDTEVPFQLIRTINDIRTDGAGWDVWRVPGAFERAADVLRGYAQENARAHPKVVAWDYSALAAYAWQVGRFDVARHTLDLLHDDIVPAGFAHALVLPRRAISGTFAFTEEHGEELMAAESSLKTDNNFDAAIRTYESLAAQIKPNDRARNWILSRPIELRQMHEFQGGQWVELLPADDALSALEVIAGKWSLEKDAAGKPVALIGESDSAGLSIVSTSLFGSHFELRGTVEILNKADVEAPTGGLTFGVIDANRFGAMWVRPGIKRALMRYDADKPFGAWEAKLDAAGSNAILTRIWDSHGDVTINGAAKKVIPWFGLWAENPDSHVGFSAYEKHAGMKFRFSNLAIKKLDLEPPKPPKP